MKRERIILDSGKTLRQPRLETLTAKLDALLSEQKRLEAQIQVVEQRIRQQLAMREREVVQKDGVWFSVQVRVTEKEAIDEALARQHLSATLLRRITKPKHTAKVRVQRIPQSKALQLRHSATERN